MLRRIIPAVDWVRSYRRSELRGDIVAGLTVGVMLVPQAMAYAMLAGLPPAVGLYASTFPLIAYALFGTSRHLAVGPVAMVSLLVLAAAGGLAEEGSEELLALAALLALMVGAAQVVLGVLRLGFLANFMSHAVISGFTSAAAIVIAVSQCKHLLGVKLASGGTGLEVIAEVAVHLPQTHGLTFALGAVAVAVLALLRWKLPRFPGAIVAVAAGAAVVYALRLNDAGVAIVGEVPRGLPAPRLPASALGSIGALAPAALSILFVGYMESIAIAQVLAVRERYRIDPSREFTALGVANCVAGLFGGYPVTGGFSRTAVNHQAGARTGLAGVVTGAVVILALWLFTPLFHYLPNAVLAAIVVVAVAGLIDVREARELFRIKRADGWTLVLTFVATLALEIDYGILMGIGFSFLQFLWRSARPYMAVEGYLADEDVFRNVERFPAAQTWPKALILRVDASLYFANMGFVASRLHGLLADRPEVKWVVLDLAGVNSIDAVAIRDLGRLMENYKTRGVGFVFAGVKGPVRDLLARADWAESAGGALSHVSVEQALRALGLMTSPPAD